MLRTGLTAALCAGLALLSPIFQRAEAHSPPPVLQSSNVIEVQWPGQWRGYQDNEGYRPAWAERRERCDRMRQALQETSYRRQFAGPWWERERLETRYHQIRERLRHECWG